jgi:bacterial/archaeal transporter family protein
MWWIYALLSALFAALTALFAKTGVTGIDSDLATGIRTVIILAIVWAIIVYRGVWHQLGAITSQNWFFLVLSGVCTGVSWLFYFRALQSGRLSLVAPVDKLSIALTVLLAVLFLGEPLTLKVVLGVFLIVTGALILIH